MTIAVPPLSPAAVALNRFGLGARPGEPVPADPRKWLLDQFAAFEVRPAGFDLLPDAGEVVQQYELEQRAERQATKLGAPLVDARGKPVAFGTPAAGDAMKAGRQEFRQDVQALYRAGVQARADSALGTPAPFVERMVHFWSNHFCVSADNPRVTAFAGAFERDAIRPHVLGRFEDMLVAAERHPAMLIYLNQLVSIGPDSAAGQRDRKKQRGLNENLAREIMELHTLGVRSGYGQGDVTEFARAMTGWTVDGLGPGAIGRGDPDGVVFRPAFHEPGARTILGRRYDQEGEAQARAVLADFARAPQTATHVATKLARHFTGDVPPPALVARLAKSLSDTGGDLPALYRTLIAAPEPWAPRPLKFKSPWEWTISAYRGLGRTDTGVAPIAGLQNQLGQPVWKPGSPAGWDDTDAAWAAPDALLRRVEVAARIAAPLGDHVDARSLAPKLIPASLRPDTAEQVTRSESPAGALALLLVSPDFLRR